MQSSEREQHVQEVRIIKRGLYKTGCEDIFSIEVRRERLCGNSCVMARDGLEELVVPQVVPEHQMKSKMGMKDGSI